MRLSLVVCQEIWLVQHAFYGSLAECFALGQNWDSFCRWSGHGKAPRPRLLPSPCGYIYLGSGTQQLGRSLPLSGCLACPGLEAIVICYCSGGGGEGRMKVLLTASRHPLSLSLLSELCWNGQVSCLTFEQEHGLQRVGTTKKKTHSFHGKLG